MQLCMYELCGCFQKWQHALFSLCVQLFEIFTLTNLWCLCKYFLPKEIVFNLLNEYCQFDNKTHNF